MSDGVKVKVLRMHFGDQGTKMEGETYETDKAHAAQLANLHLVQVVGEAKAEPAPANKSETVPDNKGGGSTETPPVVVPTPDTPPAKPKVPARKRAPKAK